MMMRLLPMSSVPLPVSDSDVRLMLLVTRALWELGVTKVWLVTPLANCTMPCR